MITKRIILLMSLMSNETINYPLVAIFTQPWTPYKMLPNGFSQEFPVYVYTHGFPITKKKKKKKSMSRMKNRMAPSKNIDTRRKLPSSGLSVVVCHAERDRFAAVFDSLRAPAETSLQEGPQL